MGGLWVSTGCFLVGIATTEASAQTDRSAAIQMDRNLGLGRPRRTADKDVCPIERRIGRRVCKTCEEWRAEAKRLGKQDSVSLHSEHR